ncbi:MAG: M20/M25/M40 family metallo-hydrolase [Hyphomonadaceae bacterium]|nr:M20/M25/M40 family metallo-hydrolase [Hyphomonadaceae bacterium]
MQKTFVSRLIAAAAGAALLFTASASAQAPSEAQRAQARAILEAAVNMDTSVEGDRNPELAQYLAGLFREAGFPAEDIHVLPHNETAALVVRYRGDGTGGRPILAIAHMDVVTAHRADWERDPFTFVEENGFFYGRGVFDNKAGLAAVASTFLTLKAEGFVPTRDLIIAFSGDEETSGATVRMMLEQHRDLIDAEYALNSDGGAGSLNEEGQPTVYSMQTAEKSYASYTLTARNPGGHSSAPRPDNAIYDISEALERVRAYQFPVMWNDTTIASFRANGPIVGGDTGAAMTRFAQRPGDRRASETLSANPFMVGQIRTTCVPTMLTGGHADNALPQSAVATINCRIFPGISLAEVQAQLQRLAGERVQVAQMDQYWASDASPLREDITAAVTASVHANYPDVPIVPGMSAGATDGVFYRGAGIPTYGVDGIFIKDSDDYSHGLNERVPVQSFYNDLTHWRVLLTTLAGPN